MHTSRIDHGSGRLLIMVSQRARSTINIAITSIIGVNEQIPSSFEVANGCTVSEEDFLVHVGEGDTTGPSEAVDRGFDVAPRLHRKFHTPK